MRKFWKKLKKKIKFLKKIWKMLGKTEILRKSGKVKWSKLKKKLSKELRNSVQIFFLIFLENNLRGIKERKMEIFEEKIWNILKKI